MAQRSRSTDKPVARHVPEELLTIWVRRTLCDLAVRLSDKKSVKYEFKPLAETYSCPVRASTVTLCSRQIRASLLHPVHPEAGVRGLVLVWSL